MDFQTMQVSSLEKVRQGDSFCCDEIFDASVLPGERFSYQICVRGKKRTKAAISVESEFGSSVRMYFVKDVFMDLPATEADMEGDDYITLEPGPMPDVLVPIEEQGCRMTLSGQVSTIWVRVDVPRDAKPGSSDIRVKIIPVSSQSESESELVQVMHINVIPAVMPEQRLIYTRWFYADCVAVQHHVEIHSEAYWEWIDRYIAAAADAGINMILVPVHTPPLDTAVGTQRPCVQLVDIEKKGETYEFSFVKFKRFIDLCKKNGIRYFEIAHMFSQWGAHRAPNIMVTENGKEEYLFGWHVAADSAEYSSFLKQYIEAISQELEAEGISENTYFHISDEPTLETMETYKRAAGIIKPLIRSSKSFDAVSNYEFYEKGLVECPVTSIAHIHEFLSHSIENQWVYYCCIPEKVYSNSFLAMPSARTRILGFLMYKYNIKGFLHWGFNFYNSELSRYAVNPYLTTSADQSFPSGDPYIVYPGRDRVYPSIRGAVTYEAIQDMDICFALEAHIGRESVVKMIDRAAGYELRFDHYPKGKRFIEALRAEMIENLLNISKSEERNDNHR